MGSREIVTKNCWEGSVSIQKQGAGKVQQRFQVQCRIALFQAILIAQQEMAVLHHPQITNAIMHSPKRLTGYRAGRKQQHDRANLTHVVGVLSGFAMEQARDTEGEEQPVFIEKIQRGKAVPLT